MLSTPPEKYGKKTVKQLWNEKQNRVLFFDHPVDLHFLTTRFKCYLGSELNSVKELLNTIKIFSLFTCLKSNLGKGEISGIGALKGLPWQSAE